MDKLQKITRNAVPFLSNKYWQGAESHNPYKLQTWLSPTVRECIPARRKQYQMSNTSTVHKTHPKNVRFR